MTNESAGISYVVGAPERQPAVVFSGVYGVKKSISNKQNTLRMEEKVCYQLSRPRDPITF